MKDFYSWNERKIKIDSNKKYHHPKEKEVWWCSIGLNVGTEIFGKSSYYTRPVLIINAEGSENFIGIPLTSKIKNGKYCCSVELDHGVLSTVLVYKIRNFDKRRLVEKIGYISNEHYKNVYKCFLNLYKVL